MAVFFQAGVGSRAGADIVTDRLARRNRRPGIDVSVGIVESQLKDLVAALLNRVRR
jgi:hypothetical protein